MSKDSKRTRGAASEAGPNKKPAAPKAANRKAKKKSGGAKKTARPATRRRGPEHSPRSLHTQQAVWQLYPDLLSIREVARRTGASEKTVRAVLESDRDRMRAMIAHFQEELAARWERTHERALGIVENVMRIAEAMLREIQQAAEEDRLTNIRDKDGFKMPVLDATQYVVMSRLLDQVNRLSQQAHTISVAYRTGDGFREMREAVGGGAGGDPDFEAMSDMEIAGVIREGGLELPPLLERKIRQVENRAAQGGRGRGEAG